MVNPAGRTPPAGQIMSMTGFAAERGEGAGRNWVWDVRSVNGKGLDVRLRLPEGIDGLDQAVRAAVARVAQRGNISVSLKLSASEAGGAYTVDGLALAAALKALKAVEEAALSGGVDVSPPSTAEVLSLRGVLVTSDSAEDTGPLLAALVADLNLCLAAFVASRAGEGRALRGVIDGQVDRIAELAGQAASAAEARRPQAAAALSEALARVASTVDTDPARVAQELALLAVKADVTEELDRLTAHIGAARGLLSEGGAVGRKLDFLMQEFMREANTLCSKSGDKALTRIGLDLKTVIDQMREQVQNVE